MKKILSLVCFFILFSFSSYGEETFLEIKQQLDRMNREITDLQKTLYSDSNNLLKETANLDNTSAITVFDMRLRDIESELQGINLNYENISFEIDDLKKTLKNLSLELSDAILAINTKIANNTINNKQDDDEVNLNEALENNTLGSLKISSNDLSNTDNTKNTNKKIIYENPEKQFQAAFDNLRSQKFEQAKSDLELFIKEHPSNVLAGSAHYWLGEIYFLQKEYLIILLIYI